MRLQLPIKKLENVVNFVPYKLNEQIQKTLSSIGKNQKFHYIVYYTHAYKIGVGPIVL